MKTLIPILIGLLLVGCGKKKDTEATTSKGDDNNSIEIQARKLTAEEKKVVGVYGLKKQSGDIKKWRLLKDGAVELLYNNTVMLSAEETDALWKVVNGEIQITGGGPSHVYRINEDRSITFIARIGKDGEREDFPKEEQDTFKKIK